MGDRQSVEVSYCPTCRGVWVERGNMDKIIERSAAAPVNARREEYREHDDRDRYNYHGHDHDHEYGGRKRKSFLAGLFD